VAVNEGKNGIAAKGCTGTDILSQGNEPNTDTVSLKVSSDQKCDENKKRDDNSNIFEGTCRKDHKDEKFPRLVDSCNLYNVTSCYSAVILLKFQFYITTTDHTTTLLGAFFWDHPDEPVLEENFWTLWCKERFNRGRHTDHPAGCHAIQTKQCPPPSPMFFYRPDARCGLLL